MLNAVLALLGSKLAWGLLSFAAVAGVWFGLPWLIELLGWDPKAIILLFPLQIGAMVVLGLLGTWLVTVGVSELLD
jgi:hypothetical protein